MEVTRRLKERFCKDYNLPIKIFDEPYFTDRITLLDPYYRSLSQWNKFLKFVINNPKYRNEEDYFEEYNRVKDEAINFIKGTDAYQTFNSQDMNQFAINPLYRNLRSKDIYHAENAGRRFISIDMRQANFNSLHHYSPEMFNGKSTWIEFLQQYTNNPHILHSKYIRQVILGNCNPKRHITYEKHLMSKLLDEITMMRTYLDLVVFFSNDEIVFDITDAPDTEEIRTALEEIANSWVVPIKVESFTLNKIEGIDGYYKAISTLPGGISVEFKCVDSFNLPFVIRKMKGEPVTDMDRTFVFEGRLARFID